MVKHTQTIRRQIADQLLSVFYHFVGLVLERLNKTLSNIYDETFRRKYCKIV